MNFNLRKLEIFFEVVRCGNISRAAQRLSLTQPAVSSAISSLESEVGFLLFKRTKYAAELTPEARHMAESVDHILASCRNLERLSDELRNGRVGKLQVGCMPGLSYSFLPKVISGFHAENPEARIALKTFDSKKVVNWVKAGHCDIGIAEMPETPTNLITHSYQLKMLCAVHIDSPLAQKEVITVQDMHEQPMITLEESHPVTSDISTLFRKACCNLNVIAEIHVFPSGLSMVNEGMGSMLVDPVTARDFTRRSDSQIVLKPFEPDITFDVAVILPALHTSSRLCQAFYQQLKSKIDELVEKNITPEINPV
ncbi:LysR family transcriptional regulator [Spongorhabdus nitratireducens]